MNVVAAITILATAVSLGLGLYVLSRGPRLRLNRIFFAITLVLVIYGIGDLVSVTAQSASVILLGRRISFTGWCLLGPLFLQFSMAIAGYERRLRHWWAYLLLYGPFVAFVAVSWATHGMFLRVDRLADGSDKLIGGWMWYPVYGCVIAVIVAGIAIMSVKWATSRDPREKETAGFVVVAALIPLVGGLVTEWLIPYKNIRPPVNSFTLMIVMAAITAYAVSRRGLMSTLVNALGGTVVTVMNDPVLVIDTRGLIEFANTAAGMLTGTDEKTLTGSTLEELFARSPSPKGLLRHIIKGGEVNAASELVLADGREVPVSIAAGPIKTRAGRHLGSFIILHDMRAALELLRAEERARLAAREAELQRRHSDELQDILDIAGHELRHPAAAFRGFSTTLLEEWERLDAPQRKGLLEEIDKAADRLTGLAIDLHDASHYGSGSISITREQTNTRELIAKAVESMRERGYAQEARLDDECAPIPLSADAGKIVTVLTILMDNAVKFSPAGSPVDAGCRQGDGEVIMFVRDRGRGVPEEHREMIFTRFHQVDDAAHHSLPGLGLGLYVAAKIVAAHGGWIKVEPREGGGSVFSFGIPD